MQDFDEEMRRILKPLACALARLDEKDPEFMTNSGLVEWECYLPEAKRYVTAFAFANELNLKVVELDG